MRKIDLIVIHCSATREDRTFTEQDLEVCHRRRGFNGTGYHFYIRKNGAVTQHRKLLEVGAHARGFNRCSIGICYEGGLDEYGNPADTRTPIQKAALLELLYKLYKLFPQALIVGHGELPGIKKDCPCFSCDEYRYRLH